MLLAPSEIHFLHDSASSYILTPDVIDDVGHQLLQQSNERVPRIQVVEKDGSWFALNDSYLRVYRELERQGRCPKIRVEVVALSKVPQNVQKGMIVGEEKSEDVSGPVRSRRVVANRQQTTKADVHGYSGSGDGGAGGTLVAAARCQHGVYGVGPGHCCPPTNQPGPLSNGGAAETGLNPGGTVPADCAESYSSTDCSDCDEEDEEDDDDYGKTNKTKKKSRICTFFFLRDQRY